MRAVQYLTVTENENGIRLNKWFKNRFPALQHGVLQKLLRTGQIRINSCRAKANDRVKAEDNIRVPPLNLRLTQNANKKINIQPHTIQDLATVLIKRILHKDDDILAINKPSGIAVQGGTKVTVHLDAALDGLKLEKKERPRLVHRLDRDTSGVIVLARSAESARWLSAAFKARETRKLYWALVSGLPREEKGIIDLALKKLPGNKGEKMMAGQKGKSAKTFYKVVDKVSNQAAWLILEPKTGRTHQLRAHTAFALETPIIGDGKYGGRKAYPVGLPCTKSMQLHSRAIRLSTPNGQKIQIEAPMPHGMKINFDFLGFNENEEGGRFYEQFI